MDNVNLLRCLINASEKAANIARVCRENDKLLALLIQEKTGEEANSRFDHDFKTLADVLIQETIKHDVGSKFPALCNAIKGEESPIFTTYAGESVSISVGARSADTAKCLSAVLYDNPAVAELLADEVHRDVVCDELKLGDIPKLQADFDYANFGIWIDPIDATAEYISGESIFTDFPGITSTGLDCVTVLIGVYDRFNGEAIAGVITQPFHHKSSANIYKSQVFWGISLGNLQANNCKLEGPPLPVRSRYLSIFSSSEHADILQRISELGYEFAFSAGAGHKALKVITAEVDLYLLSKGSTFKWDTCAPQAILRSLGGDMFNFRESIKQRRPVAVNYLESNIGGTSASDDWRCNKGGLIAVRDLGLVQVLLDKLAE